MLTRILPPPGGRRVRRRARNLLDGNILDCVTILADVESVAKVSNEIIQALKQKHPKNSPICAHTPPRNPHPFLASTLDKNDTSIKAFPSGSGGPDALPPAYLEKLIFTAKQRNQSLCYVCDATVSRLLYVHGFYMNGRGFWFLIRCRFFFHKPCFSACSVGPIRGRPGLRMKHSAVGSVWFVTTVAWRSWVYQTRAKSPHESLSR